MGKKIVVITGSPRKGGNSFALTGAFIERLKAKGHSVIRFDAAFKQVRACNACGKCYENGKACVFDDDFNALAPEIESADAVVFTTPLYWFTFSAQIKAVIDRFYAFSHTGREIGGKESALIACCGGDISVMDGLAVSYGSMVDYLKWISLGMALIPDINDPGEVHKTDGIDQVLKLAEKF